MTSLSGALPETRAAFDALAAYARTKGITIGLADFGGVRTLADTNRILGYRQDDFQAAVNAGQIPADTSLNVFRPIAPFGRSYHNYGAAFDIAVIARPSNVSESQAQAILGGYAPAIGLRWGGRFSNPDYPHFELAIPLETAQQRYVQSGGTSTATTSAFDLSKFLPSLTPSASPTDDPISDAGFPDVDGSVSGDDSGEAVFADVGGADVSFDTSSMMLVGIVVAGVVVWVIHRQFSR